MFDEVQLVGKLDTQVVFEYINLIGISVIFGRTSFYQVGQGRPQVNTIFSRGDHDLIFKR
jgi:hypothetical protein